MEIVFKISKMNKYFEKRETWDKQNKSKNHLFFISLEQCWLPMMCTSGGL